MIPQSIPEANAVMNIFMAEELKEIKTLFEEDSYFDNIKFNENIKWQKTVIYKIITMEIRDLTGISLQQKVKSFIHSTNVNKTFNAILDFINWYNNK